MKWETNKAKDYADAFNMPEIELFQQAISNMSNAEPSQELIDSLASNLNELLLSPAQKCGMERKVAKRPKKKEKKVNENQWFNRECQEKRREYLSYKNKVNAAKGLAVSNDGLRERLSKKAKEYKKLISAAKQSYFKNMRKTLKDLRSSRPKDYWDMLKNSIKPQNHDNQVPLEEFKIHFEKLSQNDKQPKRKLNLESQFNLGEHANSFINGKLTKDEVKKTDKETEKQQVIRY